MPLQYFNKHRHNHYHPHRQQQQRHHGGDGVYNEYRRALHSRNSMDGRSIEWLTDEAHRLSFSPASIAQAISDFISEAGEGNANSVVYGMYVLDSVARNLPIYRQLFSTSIIPIFARAYRVSTSRDAQNALLMLRRSWCGIFASDILRRLDSRLASIDSSWPTTCSNRRRVRGYPAQPPAHINRLTEEARQFFEPFAEDDDGPMEKKRRKVEPINCINTPTFYWPYGDGTNGEEKKDDIFKHSDDHMLVIANGSSDNDVVAHPVRLDLRELLPLSVRTDTVRAEFVCDSATRKVYMNSREVLSFGDGPVIVEHPSLPRPINISYVGPRVHLWIDCVPVELREDYPLVERVLNDGQCFLFRFDGKERALYVRERLIAHYTRQRAFWMSFTDEEEKSGRTHEIRFIPPTRQITIDGLNRTMRYDLSVPCVESADGRFSGIRFDNEQRSRHVEIDGLDYLVSFGEPCRVKFGRKNDSHQVSWGGPGFEIIVNGMPYEVQFNAPARPIYFGRNVRMVRLRGSVPAVKVLGELHFPTASTSSTTVITTSRDPAPESPVNASAIYEQCVRAGLIKNTLAPVVEYESARLAALATNRNTTELPPQEDDEDSSAEDFLENLDHFDMRSLSDLYQGSQCGQCGMRFDIKHPRSVFEVQDPESERNEQRLKEHLDLHFKRNKQKRAIAMKQVQPHRGWYPTRGKWLLSVKPKPAANDCENSSSSSNVQEGEEKDERETGDCKGDILQSLPRSPDTATRYVAAKQNSCPIIGENDDEVCCVCGEGFDRFYSQEMEEWRFANAIRNDFGVFHSQCISDFHVDEIPYEPEENSDEIDEQPTVSLEEIEEIEECFGDTMSQEVKDEIGNWRLQQKQLQLQQQQQDSQTHAAPSNEEVVDEDRAASDLHIITNPLPLIDQHTDEEQSQPVEDDTCVDHDDNQTDQRELP